MTIANWRWKLLAVPFALFAAGEAAAAITCARTITADVIALDQPIMFNRLGAQNVNGMMYALRRDVINKVSRKPLTLDPAGAVPGQVELRPDKRTRPMVLRIAAGDCLAVTLTNLLAPAANPNDTLPNNVPPFNIPIDDQVADRQVGFHVGGMQLVNSIADDSSMVGRVVADPGSLVPVGQSKTYVLFGEKEGGFLSQSYGAPFGAEGTQGNSANGLFGQVNVQPKRARIFRSMVTEEELRLATVGTTPAGQPIINYEARYPNVEPWISEGKAGLPVLNMIDGTRIVHTDINAVVAGPNADGTFPADTYPLESVGKRNPSVPNRLEPFREFASNFHDEVVAAQAFPGFFKDDPVFAFVTEGVRDAFMINYGSAGIGSEIIANRLRVGPMHDCLECAFEEFFLSSWTIADPATLVDVPANVGLETLRPGQTPRRGTTGPKANAALFPDDPANVHHSYTNDFVKFRNTHVGKEQHVFHLHNHQWLFDSNDDNSNYLDVQGIGPNAGYTYEIAFGGSGNRNKTTGDAIFHCHFYPHFAQGMWYLWRVHDVFEGGTKLQVSGTAFHSVPFALKDGTPAAGSRALPDGEIVFGVAIPALVPLPGKAIAPIPGRVTVKPNPFTVAGGRPTGSLANVIDRNINPGYPFWLAGMEHTVGQRATTPVLDMVTPALATQLRNSGDPLFRNLDPAQADGFDGGLPRHALHGFAAGGQALSVLTRLDWSKETQVARPEFFPEQGTDVETTAMRYHAIRNHPSFAVDFNRAVTPKNFVTNGSGGPSVGAPFHEPCIDDVGQRLNNGVIGQFFSGDTPTGLNTRGSSFFTADRPRVYKGSDIQFDAVFNKVGYHYPQQRILTLWADAVPTINKAKPPEPLVMRLNTFDCAVYSQTNLIPKDYELDDFEVRTPTDIMGQHIHLPKWDLTTTDGAANGWNYEDGALSPGKVRERIDAIRAFNKCKANDPRNDTPACPLAKPHPFFGQFGRNDWVGARTIMERWFADPLVNVDGIDRGLGVIFTHDHYGPSTHQQLGLYATVIIEPAASRWVQNETGVQLGAAPDGTGGRFDGGPTSWQAAILTPNAPVAGNTVKSETIEPHREFFLEYGDFNHGYEAGIYVGAGQDGIPLPGTGAGQPVQFLNAGNPQFTGLAADLFRFAINPPAKQDVNPVFPDIIVEVKGGVIPGCPARPCPQAISVDDPGLFVVNYRQESVGLRVFDPNRTGPDNKPGTQAAGAAGDLAFALQSRTDRAIALLNVQPAAGTVINGTRFPPPINFAGVNPGDPFTPMLRTFAGDVIRVKTIAGSHEEEHNMTMHGLKWLQGGASFGASPNSGWRNAQANSIAEQFTLSTPVVPFLDSTPRPLIDYAYAVDSSNDGFWVGIWGLIRAYENDPGNLFKLPTTLTPVKFDAATQAGFVGACPVAAPVRPYDITAVEANAVLPPNPNVLIQDLAPNGHTGAAPLNNGRTLVYNHRQTTVGGQTVTDPETGVTTTFPRHQGPIHDPTAMLYVMTGDLQAAPVTPADVTECNAGGVTNPACPVLLNPNAPIEPVVVRSRAGECITVTLRNRLPANTLDLATFSRLQGNVKRDRFNPQGSTTFQTNLIQPSSFVGLHPQLVAFDVSRANGIVVGSNTPGNGLGNIREGVVGPGGVVNVRWYAGDLAFTKVAGEFHITATPIEFGGGSLQPADIIEQGAKSLVGTLVVAPPAATWVEDTAILDHQDGVGTRPTRTQVTVCPGGNATCTIAAAGAFRDFSLVQTKGNYHYFRDSFPVEHLNGEGVGVPEDSQDSTGMAFNYGIEPLWFRFGLAANAPFGNTPGGFGGVPNAHQAFSNILTGGQDPVTPVFIANAGKEARVNWVAPYGTSRGTTSNIHGHVFGRQPYICPGSARLGLAGACNLNEVASRAIGTNPFDMYVGGIESQTPSTHFVHRLPSAGGNNAVPGDYLVRDQGGFGATSGLWGILRVQ